MVEKEVEEMKKRDIKFSNKSMKDFIKLGGKTHDINLLKSNAGRLRLVKEETNLLVDYFKLLTQTDYLADEMKDFFISGLSYAELTEKHGKADWNNIIAKGLKSIYDDSGNDIFYALVHKELDEDNIASLSKLIHSRFEELGFLDTDLVSSYFSFDIESKAKVDLVFNSNVDDDDFSDLCDMVKIFVIPYQQLVLSQLESEHLGYVKHLLDTPDSNLSKKDIERKRHIVNEWGLF